VSSQNPWWGKTLRIAGIVLMSLTAAFTLLGGAGTTCVALNPTGFGGRFAGIAPFQWLYVVFVLVTVAIGAVGVRAAVLLVNGARQAYRWAVLTLAAGTLVGAIHMAASRALRGGSMPVDMVVYTTIFTLMVFLIFRLPGVWMALGFESPAASAKRSKSASAIALAATGVLSLTTQFLMAPTHTINGINYADAWHAALTIIGAALLLAGIRLAAFVQPWRAGRLREVRARAILPVRR
jgi:hypothetical protein